MYKFDKTDVKIVNLLLENGRMSASEMSRRVGNISERLIRYRIERMVNAGVIQIGAVVNPEVLGFTIRADVWLEVDAALGRSDEDIYGQFKLRIPGTSSVIFEGPEVSLSNGTCNIGIDVDHFENFAVFRFPPNLI